MELLASVHSPWSLVLVTGPEQVPALLWAISSGRATSIRIARGHSSRSNLWAHLHRDSACGLDYAYRGLGGLCQRKRRGLVRHLWRPWFPRAWRWSSAWLG